MKLADDEVRALGFIAALIALTLVGRWVDRPRPVGLDQPAVDVEALAARSEQAMQSNASRRGRRGHSAEGPETRGAVTPPRPRVSASERTPLDINRASAGELERLPGIGPALAARIVAWRDSAGRFESVDQLDAVKGIGPAMLARLKPLLRVAE